MSGSPDADLEEDHTPVLWDPDLLGLATLVFTPIFGSVLLGKNWQALGEAAEAKVAKRWLIASLVMLIPCLAMPAVYVAYYIAWYFIALRKQMSYVQVRYRGVYRRQFWALPLFFGLLVFVFVAGSIAFFAVRAGMGHH